jgi:RND family efflux transporter MFP subunit
MTTIQFLAEWALRSSILILAGALLLWMLRVKDSAVRLVAWTAALCGSLAIPALNVVAPSTPLPVVQIVSRVQPSPAIREAAPSAVAPQATKAPRRLDWATATLAAYWLVALTLLLRLGFGLSMSLRLLRRSRAAHVTPDGTELRESDSLTAPVTLGILKPTIVLPVDWREWDQAKLDAVVAHERSHIRRRDPAVQLLSAIHRALLWHSPLSWYLHRRIVCAAEEVSDDAAIAATGDRAFYARMLLEFMQRGLQRPLWHGVPMARYGRQDRRVHRILDNVTVSRGVTRTNVAAILALGIPLAYEVASAHPSPLPPLPAPVIAMPIQAASASPQPASQTAAKPVQEAQAAAPAAAAPQPAYIEGLGNVAPLYVVNVRSRVDGQLMSVNFQEGRLVQAGQLLATIDPRAYEAQVQQAEGQLDSDQALLNNARTDLARQEKLAGMSVIPKEQLDAPRTAVAQIEGKVKTDLAVAGNAKLQLIYTHITAPITGAAGLRLIDPGNLVHASDASAIVTITQLQPIAVVFSIPEDAFPRVWEQFRAGNNLRVDAWNRDHSVKIATGRLTGIDNQIDATTGAAKLKAEFDNKDEALFPNQFVIVRLFPATR